MLQMGPNVATYCAITCYMFHVVTTLWFRSDGLILGKMADVTVVILGKNVQFGSGFTCSTPPELLLFDVQYIFQV